MVEGSIQDIVGDGRMGVEDLGLDVDLELGIGLELEIGLDLASRDLGVPDAVAGRAGAAIAELDEIRPVRQSC